MTPLLNHIYEYDTVVVGSDVRSLLYAYSKELPIVLVNHRIPYIFEYAELDWDLSHFGLENTPTKLLTSKGEQKIFGQRIEYIWNYLLLAQGMRGRNLFGGLVEEVRIDKDILKVMTYRRYYKIRFSNLVIFEHKDVHGILADSKRKRNNKYKVLDWIAIKKSASYKTQYIETDDFFISEIFRDGNYRSMAVSHLTKAQINSGDFSGAYLQLRLRDVFEEAGILGRWKDRKFRKLIQCIPEEREILIVKDPIVFEDTENIKFMNHAALGDLL